MMQTFLLNVSSHVNVEQVLEKLLNLSIEAGKSILAAILIYVIGRFIIKYIMRFVTTLLAKRKMEISVQTFLKSLLSIILNLVLTSLAALLASAGVAIGMALSGNLSNFAGGLIILVFKPFKVGDYIDAPGGSGTVKEIQIFHTLIATTDNRMIYIPNGLLSSNAVTNYNKQETRRIDWTFGVEYGEDVQKVRDVLQRIVDADKRILQEPKPMIVLQTLNASSVDILVRVWVKSADYWTVLYEVNELVYDTFNKEGIGFPFPQLTVHQAQD